MKKILIFASLIMMTSLFVACDKTKTPQEKMKDEKKAIERFIARNGIEVLKNFPADSIFKENQYYLTSQGLYLHIIDFGDGTKAKNNQEIYVRYDGMMNFKNDTIKRSNMSSYRPDVFYLNNSYTYTGLSCEGWNIAMNYVSNNGEVSIILPSSLQSYSYQEQYAPLFYKTLKFRL